MKNGLLTIYSRATPPELFDPRCEFEVPRFCDLADEDDLLDLGCSGGQSYLERSHSTTGGVQVALEEEFFQWFQLPHDFAVDKRPQPKRMRGQKSCGNLQPSIAEAIKKVLHHGYSNSTVCQTERKASPPKPSRNQLARTLTAAVKP